MRRIVLLPGMDGSGRLFAPFIDAAPPRLHLEVVALPQERLGYADLAARLRPTLHLTADTVLLAESFSGPLAVLLAARTRVAAVILCNSFVTHPVPKALRHFIPTALLRLRAPAIVLRHLLLGVTASDSLVTDVQAALASVSAAVLAGRLAATCNVDVAADVARIECPLLYLRGANDRLVRESSVAAVCRAAPNAVVRRVPGPHLLLQAMPAAAWAPIHAFVEQLA
jgi:pimeloyl-[acyl-carrier protein] methyl ester esterase